MPYGGTLFVFVGSAAWALQFIVVCSQRHHGAALFEVVGHRRAAAMGASNHETSKDKDGEHYRSKRKILVQQIARVGKDGRLL